MKTEDFDKGLQARGFIGIEECINKGKCHLNNKHYILITDGLVIYSTCDWWDRPSYQDIIKQWNWEDFNFSELDCLLYNRGA